MGNDRRFHRLVLVDPEHRQEQIPAGPLFNCSRLDERILAAVRADWPQFAREHGLPYELDAIEVPLPDC